MKCAKNNCFNTHLCFNLTVLYLSFLSLLCFRFLSFFVGLEVGVLSSDLFSLSFFLGDSTSILSFEDLSFLSFLSFFALSLALSFFSLDSTVLVGEVFVL